MVRGLAWLMVTFYLMKFNSRYFFSSSRPKTEPDPNLSPNQNPDQNPKMFQNKRSWGKISWGQKFGARTLTIAVAPHIC